jgi:hypothetical protein
VSLERLHRYFGQNVLKRESLRDPPEPAASVHFLGSFIWLCVATIIALILPRLDNALAAFKPKVAAPHRLLRHAGGSRQADFRGRQRQMGRACPWSH